MLNDVDYEKYGTAGQQKGLLEDDASIEEPRKSLCSNFLKYYVAVCTSLIAFLQGWIWNTYGPISITVEKEDVFGWNDSIVAFLGNWGPIAYVVAFYPTAVLLDAYGLRTSSLAAMLLIFLSCAVGNHRLKR